MDEITLGLALEDYVTVIFFAIGLYYLWHMSRAIDRLSGRLVAVGGLLITLGGAAKATWKLLIVLIEKDVWWLDNSHFILMTPGYIYLAAGILLAIRKYGQPPRGGNALILSSVLIALSLVTAGLVSMFVAGRAWFFVLLGIATLANIVLSGALVSFSRRHGLDWVAGLFLLNIVLVFLLAGMSGLLDRSLIGQWIEQITGNISFGAFALASWKLHDHIRVR